MAIKDWKLINDIPKGKYWLWTKSDNKGYGKISITRFISWGTFEEKPFKNREPYFEVTIDDGKFEEKKFKTKSQALKYARAYMRKH